MCSATPRVNRSTGSASVRSITTTWSAGTADIPKRSTPDRWKAGRTLWGGPTISSTLSTLLSCSARVPPVPGRPPADERLLRPRPVLAGVRPAVRRRNGPRADDVLDRAGRHRTGAAPDQTHRRLAPAGAQLARRGRCRSRYPRDPALGPGDRAGGLPDRRFPVDGAGGRRCPADPAAVVRPGPDSRCAGLGVDLLHHRLRNLGCDPGRRSGKPAGADSPGAGSDRADHHDRAAPQAPEALPSPRYGGRGAAAGY